MCKRLVYFLLHFWSNANAMQLMLMSNWLLLLILNHTWYIPHYISNICLNAMWFCDSLGEERGFSCAESHPERTRRWENHQNIGQSVWAVQFAGDCREIRLASSPWLSLLLSPNWSLICANLRRCVFANISVYPVFAFPFHSRTNNVQVCKPCQVMDIILNSLFVQPI